MTARSASKRDEPPVTPLRLPDNVETVVVYGGSFDPPHRFHTDDVPRLVRDHLGDRAWVVYVPAARSPLKPRGPVAPDAARAAMLRLMVGPERVWTDECDRARWLRARGQERPSYTIESLRRLRSILPRHVKVRLLIGSDQAADFHRWKRARAIVRLAEPLVMARRPVTTRTELVRAMDHQFWSAGERRAWGQRLIANRVRPAASTSVRERIARRPRARRWQDVPVPVARYIRARGLYGATRASSR